ncbi:MAG: DUF58 domain-containing protein [Desulfobacterales bacterium]
MKKRFPPTQSDTSLPIRLNRRRIYILPTRHGVLFLLVLFGMLLGSINYNNNLGFLLVFLLGGMLLVSIIHTWRNLLGLKILSVSADPVFAGETAVFQVLARSDSLLRKAVTFGFKNAARAIANISPGAENVISVDAETGHRGWYAPGRLIIATRFPLGLFRAWANLNTGAKVVVYPRPIAGALDLIEDTAAGDDNKARQISGADDFKGLKPYQPGDAIQHIAWKTLSRGQGVFTKAFGSEERQSVMLDYAEIPSADTEYRLSRLTDMVRQASRQNLFYGLKLPGDYLPPDKGERHKHECLKRLALFEPNE